MRRLFFPRVVVGAIIVLVALHLFFTGGRVTPDGSSSRTTFPFSLNSPSSPDSGDQQPPGQKPSQPWSSWWPSGKRPADSKVDQGGPDTYPHEAHTTDLSGSVQTTDIFLSATHTPYAHSSAAPAETHTSELVPSAAYTSVVHPEVTHSEAAHSGAAHTSIEHLPASTGLSQHPHPAHTEDLHASHGNETKLPCAGWEGAEDVVFIIKTGATEVDERLRVHFNTTLRCFPKYLIFSDHGEDYEGHTIHNALDNIIDEIRLENDDFDLYRRLKEVGRAGLRPSELSINDHGDNTGGTGNPENGGWRLDKFKNVPMVGKTLEIYPDAKWYIHTDADTYIVWSNLLKWLGQMDPKRLTYLGSPALIDDQVFGHGGSGYVISNALMHKAAAAYKQNQTEWDWYAAKHWAGDCVLATLLQQLGGPLTWSYPIIQGGDPQVMNMWETGYDRRLWCYPAVSYHHIKPDTVATLWRMEQEWTARHTKQLNHSDTYKQWLLPQFDHQKDNWDNLSEDVVELTGVNDAPGCRDICQGNSTCMQYTFHDGVCKTFDTTHLGKENKGMQAGWMLDRIKSKVTELDDCKEGEWILPGK